MTQKLTRIDYAEKFIEQEITFNDLLVEVWKGCQNIIRKRYKLGFALYKRLQFSYEDFSQEVFLDLLTHVKAEDLNLELGKDSVSAYLFNSINLACLRIFGRNQNLLNRNYRSRHGFDIDIFDVRIAYVINSPRYETLREEFTRDLTEFELECFLYTEKYSVGNSHPTTVQSQIANKFGCTNQNVSYKMKAIRNRYALLLDEAYSNSYAVVMNSHIA